ncbi:MAG: cyclodeaminase/cyclohydrolase family protein [Phycisphaerales bacterium]
MTQQQQPPSSRTPLDHSLPDVLEAIAAKSPSPGGGAVAAMLAGIAAALADMVVAYSIGRKSLREHDALFARAHDAFTRARVRSLQLAEEDATAYSNLNALQRSGGDEPHTQPGWSDAVTGAIAAPLACIDLAQSLLALCEELCGRSNAWLRSDLAIAAVTAEAAVTAAAWNVRINLPLLDHLSGDVPYQRSQLETQFETALAESRAARSRVESLCA